MNADIFLTEIKKLDFTGRDFLEIIGNSKVSNSIYNEIKSNTGLTYERLVQLLDGSGLTSADYERILSDARAFARMRKQLAGVNRKESESKLGAAISEAERMRAERAEEAARLERMAALIAKAKKQADEQIQAELLFEEQTAEISEEMLEEDYNDIPVNQPETSDESDETEEDGAYEVSADDDENETEDEDGYGGEDTGADIHISAPYNKSKIIFCFVMAFVVAGASFALRWFRTGSVWLERESKASYSVPETYSELAQMLINADNITSDKSTQEAHYRISDPEPGPQTILYNSRYIFNIISGKLYAVEINSGRMTGVGEVSFEGLGAREMFLIDDRLYVIAEGTYEGSYSHVHELENNEESTQGINGDFVQKTVTVNVFDAWEFTGICEYMLILDGELNTAFIHKNKFIITTSYTPHNPEAYNDPAAFIPSYIINDNEREFIAMSNIYAPPARLMNISLTVAAVIDGVDGEVYAYAADAGEVYIGEDSLFLIQEGGSNSRIIKHDISGHTQAFTPVHIDYKGRIPKGGISEQRGLIRIGVIDGKNGTLYIINSQLEQISQIKGIGAEGAELVSVLFDEEHAYFIGDKLYAFNTAIPEDILIVNEPAVQVYNDNFYRITDRERLELAVEVRDDGGEKKRAGISLNVYKTEQGESSVVASYLIEAESSVAGDWNPYLFTDAEGSREAVFIAGAEQIVIVPVKYFNGVANVEKVLVFDYSEFAGLAKRSEIIYYDINAARRRAVLIDGYIYSFWDTLAVSASDNAVIEKFYLDSQAESKPEPDTPESESE